MGLDASRLDVLARVLFSFTKLIQEDLHRNDDRLARGTVRTARPRQDKAIVRKARTRKAKTREMGDSPLLSTLQ